MPQKQGSDVVTAGTVKLRTYKAKEGFCSHDPLQTACLVTNLMPLGRVTGTGYFVCGIPKPLSDEGDTTIQLSFLDKCELHLYLSHEVNIVCNSNPTTLLPETSCFA